MKLKTLPKFCFFLNLWISFLFFCGRTMAMAAMGMVSAGGLLGMGFHKKKYPQGVASAVFEKTPVFGVGLPKLDHLTVRTIQSTQNTNTGAVHNTYTGVHKSKCLLIYIVYGQNFKINDPTLFST
jgi:hypothetical protein